MDIAIRPPAHVSHDQRGAVLVVSLLILLVLTIIGIAAMNTTNLEEKMAGNMRARDITFQAASSALRAGEASFQSGGVWASTIPTESGTGSDKVWAVDSEGIDFSVNDTTTDNWWASNGISAETSDSYGVPNPNPQYVIENYQFVPDALDTADLAQSRGTYYFRVTARAALNNTDTVLQSIYAIKYR